ncbi:hypothetical protein M413DRAFT_447628 [Hebeloma cylindrosporum]|uniref:Uncharacterized protein n=1 Tax=Hebeloma cylindrosporum TaxID=76867 RepID=A0A0C3C323_HEBCY|nr:hypothetical protein M413DRAFT_447628 [Hebeloma cylindrosporum h7]
MYQLVYEDRGSDAEGADIRNKSPDPDMTSTHRGKHRPSQLKRAKETRRHPSTQRLVMLIETKLHSRERRRENRNGFCGSDCLAFVAGREFGHEY